MKNWSSEPLVAFWNDPKTKCYIVRVKDGRVTRKITRENSNENRKRKDKSRAHRKDDKTQNKERL